ncbi:MAG: glycine-rich protein [bacterium]|nr:glycine-rich protein [bacterium]
MQILVFTKPLIGNEGINMKKLNQKGLTLIEVIMTFTLIMVIIAGLLTIIMNYRHRISIESKRLELVTYKNTLTKEIQDDILKLGLREINEEGDCVIPDQFSSCSNIVFKNGEEKILAISKIDDEDPEKELQLLNNKYIQYGDTKYPIKDELPENPPEGRELSDFQTIFLTEGSFVQKNTIQLADDTQANIYKIDIYLEHIDYEDDFGIHIVASDVALSANSLVTDYGYTGGMQTYTVPATGTYKIELWGASGGNKGQNPGGMGSYTKGFISLTKGTNLYLYVGGAGSENSIKGGYNGGGASTQSENGSPGGGATDIRMVGGEWNDFASLKSRIMVAAGGGGANSEGKGGNGGGLNGYDGTSANQTNGTGGTQSKGGNTKESDIATNTIQEKISGGFGKVLSDAQSGAGGGWFTGGSATNGGAGGGSSYISGHKGCAAISENATEDNVTTTETTSTDKDYQFSNTLIIDGDGNLGDNSVTDQTIMPSYDGKTNDVGNKGDGHIKITYL